MKAIRNKLAIVLAIIMIVLNVMPAFAVEAKNDPHATVMFYGDGILINGDFASPSLASYSQLVPLFTPTKLMKNKLDIKDHTVVFWSDGNEYYNDGAEVEFDDEIEIGMHPMLAYTETQWIDADGEWVAQDKNGETISDYWVKTKDGRIVFVDEEGKILKDADLEIDEHICPLDSKGNRYIHTWLNVIDDETETSKWRFTDRVGIAYKNTTRTINRNLYSFDENSFMIPDLVVTFDPNGGSLDELFDKVDLNKDQKYGIMLTAQKDGYVFDGWYSKPNGGKKVDADTIVLENTDHTLYAHWKSKSSGRSSSGSSSSGSSSKTEPTYSKKPAVTPMTVAADGKEMLGNSTIAIPQSDFEKTFATKAVSGTWNTTASKNWTFIKPDGKPAKNEWVPVLASNGKVSLFRFDKDGIMMTGWQQIEGKWYFLNNEDGSMLGACLLNGTTPDGYKVGPDGAWIE